MNEAIEMHDSECLAVEVDEEGRGSVLLDAYVHRTAGEPGVSPREVGVHRIRMKIDAMTVEGDVGVLLPAYVYSGSLTVGNSVQYNLVYFGLRENEGQSVMTRSLNICAQPIDK